jgi:hypothetical protein
VHPSKERIVRTRIAIIFCAVPALSLVLLGRQDPAHSDGGGDDDDRRGKRTTIYFLRHGEDIPESVLGDILVPDCTETCCLEVLNDLGTKRAELLAAWFEERGILRRLTHVIASHKVRTLQTVAPLAAAAAESGAGLADDVDQQPGDHVQQVPPFIEECAPGFEGSASSRGPMTEFLMSLAPGSQVVVAAHSPTIYPILEAFGIDTHDPRDFPRGSGGLVSGFGNLWIVDVDATGQGNLRRHLVLDFELVKLRDARGPRD